MIIAERKHAVGNVLAGKPRLPFPEPGLSRLGLRHSGTLLHLWNLFPHLYDGDNVTFPDLKDLGEDQRIQSL